MHLVELEALDDGPPRATSFAEVRIDGPEDLPTLPTSTRAFVARGRSSDGRLVATGLFPVLDTEPKTARGPLFSSSSACGLLDPKGAPARVPEVRARITGTNGTTTLLAGGRDDDGEARADLLVIAGSTVTRLGLRRRRADATVAVLGSVAFVAGGESSSGIWEDAEVVDLAASSIRETPWLLAEPRAAASSLALPTGEALLVGGRGARGALRTLEALHPSRPVSRVLDLASLERARISPIVLRLATGEIAVLGGRDDAGAAVPDVEIFDATAARRVRVLPLSAHDALTAVALPSGAVLAVFRDPSGPGALLVRADGIDALPAPPVLGVPRLVAATDGAPWLLGDAPARFQPFSGTFASANPVVASGVFPLGSGVIAWPASVDGATTVRAFRYDLRNELTSDLEPLGLGSTVHLSPDRLGVVVGRDGLVLPAGARVSITDTTYGAFSVRLGAVGRALPALELRDVFGALITRVADDGACSWPVSDAESTEVIRAVDGSLTLRAGDDVHHCAAAPATTRVSLSIVAEGREARIKGITVVRGG